LVAISCCLSSYPRAHVRVRLRENSKTRQESVAAGRYIGENFSNF